MDIKKGRRYKCIRNVYIEGDLNTPPRYIKGKLYKSEIDGAITDETGLKEHWWWNEAKLKNCFIRVSNKRGRYESSKDR